MEGPDMLGDFTPGNDHAGQRECQCEPQQQQARQLIEGPAGDQSVEDFIGELFGIAPEVRALQDWVVDRDGRPRDLIIMSHDLEGLSDQINA